MRRITFREYSQCLTGEGYSPTEILNLYNEMKALDPQVRRWVIDWFFGGGFPGEIVEGVTVQYLVEEVGMKPMNAFIAIDWLKKDPDAAKYALTHARAPLPMEDADAQDAPEEPNDDGITDC